MVLESKAQMNRHPSAHYLNMRSLEVMKEVPGLVEGIEATRESMDLFREYIYLRRIGG